MMWPFLAFKFKNYSATYSHRSFSQQSETTSIDKRQSRLHALKIAVFLEIDLKLLLKLEFNILPSPTQHCIQCPQKYPNSHPPKRLRAAQKIIFQQISNYSIFDRYVRHSANSSVIFKKFAVEKSDVIFVKFWLVITKISQFLSFLFHVYLIRGIDHFDQDFSRGMNICIV